MDIDLCLKMRNILDKNHLDFENNCLLFLQIQNLSKSVNLIKTIIGDQIPTTEISEETGEITNAYPWDVMTKVVRQSYSH